MKTLYRFAIVAILFASCKKESITNNQALNSETSADEITYLDYISHSALPQETDASITTETGATPTQCAYLPSNNSSRKDKLFIFLPGTTGVPVSYRKIVQTAATQGYYSFGLAYSNNTDIEEYNVNANDKTIENIFEEYFTGKNTSPTVTVSKSNSLQNRIQKMIAYMDAQYPTENWKRFLNANNNIIWSKIIIAGHSQGADHAMYISQKKKTFRAAFFAGPGNFKLPNGSYPSFMTATGATTRNSVYGLNHTGDNVRPWNNVKEAWTTLQMPGNPNSADDYNVGNANKITTSIATNNGHDVTVYDDATPNGTNGRPLFEPLWIYMCFPQ